MIPGNTLSDLTDEREFLWRSVGDERALGLDESYEMGGVALGDASQGQLVQLWHIFVRNQREVWVESPTQAPVMLFSRIYPITEVSLAFDQNMRPTVAFVEDKQAYLWWYDTLAGEQVFTHYPGATNPRCTLDDKRASQAAQASIILAYIRDGGLYFRDQADRFQTEYLLSPTVPGELLEIGMAKNFRLQFKFGRRLTYEELISLYASNADKAQITQDNQVPSSVKIYDPDADVWKPGKNS